MILQLIGIALGTLASEDLACIAAGVLISQGILPFPAAVVACFAGILGGDVALFAIGRLIGRQALQWPVLRRVTPAVIDRASGWLERRGAVVILLSRFSPGLRLPTYFTAGLTRVRTMSVLVWFAGAAALWTPLLVGATVVFGEAAAHRLPLVAPIAGLLYLAFQLRDRVWRRNVQAFFCRKLRWEFWPPWAAYAPLMPYLIYLAIRHRSITLFTAANPGIPTGGLGGESKWDILRHLSKAEPFVAKSRLLAPGDETFSFPVVLKPVVGERGRGVAIMRCMDDVRHYRETATGDIIVQEYVPGVEFGVFYCRYPHEDRGRVLSITEKRLPEVIGDGSSTIHDLILDDPRAFCIAKTYLRNIRRDATSVPSPGERLALAEIGSHCRGAVFVDATPLNTDLLERAIDLVAKSHPGFFFGRFDIRAESVEAFRRGRGFKVLELNGVGGEMTHIYDPAISMREAYRVMRGQWRIAFEIGAMNRDGGTRVMGIGELLRHLRRESHVRHFPVNALPGVGE